jgi:hypothetical protein
MKLCISGKGLAAAGIVGPLATIAILNKYAKRYPATPEEAERSYPGDDLLPGSMSGGAMAIDIDAPPEAVWPLINQIGQTKAGFYSFTTFELMAGFRIHNEYTPQERWQDTKVGDWIFYGPMGVGMEVMLHKPNEYLVGMSDSARPPAQPGAVGWLPLGTDDYAWTWGFFLERKDDGGTRLISHTTVRLAFSEVGSWKGKAIVGAWGWSSGVMTTRMLEVIKKCAEGRRTGPLIALADAHHNFWSLIWGTGPKAGASAPTSTSPESSAAPEEAPASSTSPPTSEIPKVS